ncbi:MAG: hypothetical protein FWC84_04750 [Alphaproteobacteria bacterium]|nr:hypothetical protein [Alphaproteobacteria bacterium]
MAIISAGRNHPDNLVKRLLIVSKDFDRRSAAAVLRAAISSMPAIRRMCSLVFHCHDGSNLNLGKIFLNPIPDMFIGQTR